MDSWTAILEQHVPDSNVRSNLLNALSEDFDNYARALYEASIPARMSDEVNDPYETGFNAAIDGQNAAFEEIINGEDVISA